MPERPAPLGSSMFAASVGSERQRAQEGRLIVLVLVVFLGFSLFEDDDEHEDDGIT
jgi:hypothetical protein